ncbi:unnamed protein product [Effrenium voratum]|nr:unnamed protein product [Effrenium voratum]
MELSFRRHGLTDVDLLIAVEDCSSFIFERFAKRAGINIIICDSLAELLRSVKCQQKLNFHRPLAVIVDDWTSLQEMQALPLLGRVPFLMDASGAGRNLADFELVASCSFMEFRMALWACLRRWDMYEEPALEAMPRVLLTEP